nr:unnamed protein product [Callosobruchus analis]
MSIRGKNLHRRLSLPKLEYR